ncbi:hypothetical protein EVAR_23710_1 [Eumeta japonica]|uniref:Uncharacterized protein n=1 Tax=Eumeta variegata TaxID=151549 RepID=A0A4C1VH44_EUMVA|nr:hypothetical protein EVAR_23710_1 [Eumeta japonica]
MAPHGLRPPPVSRRATDDVNLYLPVGGFFYGTTYLRLKYFILPTNQSCKREVARSSGNELVTSVAEGMTSEVEEFSNESFHGKRNVGRSSPRRTDDLKGIAGEDWTQRAGLSRLG